ncbi:hypothetical protein EBT16_11345 [bacterium]|nr:hypothetical protein [bacterium]
MFKVNEIKSWAGKYGVSVKKQGEGYVWFSEGKEPSASCSIEDVVEQIFNHITGDKYKQHQKDYKSNES